MIAIRTDGTLFPNGDAWKCLTCGVPEDNRKGTLVREDPMAGSIFGGDASEPPRMPLDHPQAFPDGKRVLAGPNVIDCGPYALTSAQCTPDRVHIYPVRWNRSADGTGRGAVFREQRLNPDGRGRGLPAGKFVMDGKVGGQAAVEIEHDDGALSTIRVRYSDYTDDGQHIINGTESAICEGRGPLARVVWHSNLRSSGLQNGTKITSPGGFAFNFRGPIEDELVTTIDGKDYRRPQPGM